jgi:hypothetical protein
MEPEKYNLLTTTPVPSEISEDLPAKPVNGEESSLRASAVRKYQHSPVADWLQNGTKWGDDVSA